MGSKTAVLTDSNSAITYAKAKELGVHLIPTPFFIDGELFYEDVTLTREQFYERMRQDASITTSQPAAGDLTDLWDKLLTEYDEIVYIPISLGLSTACEVAMGLAKDYGGRVEVVDNRRVSVMQKSSIIDAKNLAEKGKSAAEIKRILEDEKYNACAYITVDTLKYLKKGGRITPAAAAIGSVLNIRPVLIVSGDKLDGIAKARGLKAAKKVMLETTKKDLAEKFSVDDKVNVYAVTSCDERQTEEWRQEIAAYLKGYEVLSDYLSLSVTCHIGPGALAVAYAKTIS